MIPAVGDLESIVIELEDPNWNIWAGRLADFQTRVQFMSRYEGRYVAGIALMPAGNRVIYEWGFSGLDPRDRKLPHSHRLYWEAMYWARKSGVVCYDMGCFWVNGDDQDPINGFKFGFSPEIQPALGEYFFPLSPILGRLTEAAISVRRWNVPGGVDE